MKRSVMFLGATLMFLSCAGKEKENLSSIHERLSYQDSKIKRYEVQSGSVKYESTIEGKVMGSIIQGKGTSNLFFKDWGAIELIEDKETKTTKTKVFGRESSQSESVHNLSKLENGKAFYVDFENREIRTQTDMAMESIQTFGNGDANQTGKDLFTSMGGEKIGTEKVLNYECEIWSLMGTKQWVYKGVPLKIEASVMGVTTIKTAVYAEFNITIDDSHFKLPDFKVVEQNDFQNNDFYEETEEDKREMKKQALKMKDMTYEEYKEMLLKEDDEAGEMSEEEIKQSYTLFKIALERMNQ